MPVNVWNAGRDELLQELARRDQLQQQRDAIARQTRLDEETRQARAAAQDLAERQLQLTKSNIEADNQRQADAAARAEQQRQATEAAQERLRQTLQVLTTQYQLEADPHKKLLYKQEILNLGGKTADAPEDKPDSRSLQLQAADALKNGDTAGYARIMKVIRDEAAAGRAPKEPGAGADESGLSPGVRSYLDSLTSKTDEAGQPYTFQRALDEVRRQIPTWQQQVETGQRGDRPNLGAITPYLTKIFPQQGSQNAQSGGIMNPASTTTPLRPGAVPLGAPNAAGTGAGVPAAPPAAGGDAALQQQAIQLLTQSGKAVTPETIQKVVEALKAQSGQ